MLFNTPNTVILQLNPDYLSDILDDNVSQNLVDIVDEIAKYIKYPVLLKTDMASHKHDYADACVIHRKQEIAHKIFNTLEFNYIVDLYPMALVIREFIKHNSTFKAFNKLPIAREYRVFWIDGKIKCIHRYWAKEVFQKDKWALRTEPKNWESLWNKMYDPKIVNAEIEEIKILLNTRFTKTELSKDNWSIDFMSAKNGKIYLIDMGEANLSYHSEHSSDLLFESD